MRYSPISLTAFRQTYQFSSKFTVISEHGHDCKGLPQQAEMAQGVPGRLRPRIFLKIDIMRVVGRQPYTPAAFTPEEIPATPFQKLSQSQGTWFCR